MQKIILTGLLAVCATVAQAADAPKNTIDNARVAVRDITLAPGDAAVAPDPDHPFVILFLDGGSIRTKDGGKTSTKMYAAGNALYGAKGAHETLEATAGHPHLYLVTLKEDAPPPPATNKSGLPLAFPRPGAKKILDNDRVTVWNSAWLPNQPTPMHFHDKDTVVVYRGEGAIASTTPDGKVTVTEDHTGNVKFNTANRIHSEKLASRQESAIVVELK